MRLRHLAARMEPHPSRSTGSVPGLSLAEYHELTAAIDRFLDTLPETERRVFLCRYWYFAGIGEIAERFGFSASKVRSMLLRCRRKLKQQLLEEGYL